MAPGLASFLARRWMPVGRTVAALRPAYFPGDVALFALGMSARRRHGLTPIPEGARRLAAWHPAASLCALPVTLVIGAAGHPSVSAFYGGMPWQAFAYAMRGPFVLLGMVITLLAWGGRRPNHPSTTVGPWARAPFVARVIHPVFLVGTALALSLLGAPPLVKFVLAGALASSAAFAAARLVRAIPAVRTIVG